MRSWGVQQVQPSPHLQLHACQPPPPNRPFRLRQVGVIGRLSSIDRGGGHGTGAPISEPPQHQSFVILGTRAGGHVPWAGGWGPVVMRSGHTESQRDQDQHRSKVVPARRDHPHDLKKPPSQEDGDVASWNTAVSMPPCPIPHGQGKETAAEEGMFRCAGSPLLPPIPPLRFYSDHGAELGLDAPGPPYPGDGNAIPPRPTPPAHLGLGHEAVECDVCHERAVDRVRGQLVQRTAHRGADYARPQPRPANEARRETARHRRGRTDEHDTTTDGHCQQGGLRKGRRLGEQHVARCACTAEKSGRNQAPVKNAYPGLTPYRSPIRSRLCSENGLSVAVVS